MGKIKNVLFMCFGNTARSPAAQGIAEWLKRSKYQEELKDIEFDSAGFFNVYKEAQPETIAFLKEKGIDFSDFRGKKVDTELLEKNDLILVMQERHLKRLKRRFKEVKNIGEKSYIIKDFAGEKKNLDIPDPVKKTAEEYRKIIDEVEDAVVKSVKKIIQINQEA